MRDELTAGELREVLDGVPDDETVCITFGTALGEATKAYRNVEGVVIEGRSSAQSAIKTDTTRLPNGATNVA